MELEKQVCSLDLAKRLKELGVKQESYFYWREQYRTDGTHVGLVSGSFGVMGRAYAAFTAAELGELLPSRLYNTMDKEHTEHQFVCEKWPNGQWNAAYVCLKCKGNLTKFQDENEADARAKMRIYLLENKLITV